MPPKQQKAFKTELGAKLCWWSCGPSAVGGSLLLKSVGSGFKCSIAKFPLCHRSFVSLPFLHVLTLLQQGALDGCPTQFFKLAHAGMVKDAVWVKHFFQLLCTAQEYFYETPWLVTMFTFSCFEVEAAERGVIHSCHHEKWKWVPSWLKNLTLVY